MKANQIALLLVLLALAAYFLMNTQPQPAPGKPAGQQPPVVPSGDPLQGFSRADASMNATWQSAGVPAQGFTFDEAALYALSDTQLKSMEEKLKQLQAGAGSDAAKKLAGIHLGIVEVARKQSEVKASSLQVAAVGMDLCNNLDKLRARDTAIAGMVSALKNYRNNVEAFKAAYPAEAQEAGLMTVNVDVAASEQNLQAKQASTAELVASCGGMG